jgi:hypothetical protein
LRSDAGHMAAECDGGEGQWARWQQKVAKGGGACRGGGGGGSGTVGPCGGYTNSELHCSRSKSEPCGSSRERGEGVTSAVKRRGWITWRQSQAQGRASKVVAAESTGHAAAAVRTDHAAANTECGPHRSSRECWEGG